MLKYIRYAWLLLPAIPYLYISTQHATNLPILDDYEAVLGTCINWNNGNWLEKIGVLFRQHNEHRLVSSHLVYVLYYSVFGDINFRNLILLGNLNLLVACAFMVYFIKKTAVKYWQVPAFIAVLLMADLNTYESGSITEYTWQNNGVLMLFFLTLYLWDRKKMVPAIIAQFFLIFSSGNGMIGVCFIAIYCLGLGRKYFIACTASMAAFIGLYFIGYTTFEDKTKTPFDINKVITYFVRETGAPFSFDNSFLYGLLILVAVASLFPFKTIRSSLTTQPLYAILLWALASMSTTALFRSCTTYAQFQTSRYLIYPQLLIAVLLVLMMIKKKKAWNVISYVVMALWVCVYYPYNFKFGEAGFERFEYRVMYVHGVLGDRYWHPEKEKAAQIAQAADAQGIYSINDNR